MPSTRSSDEYFCPFPFRVLIVENDSEYRTFLSEILTQWGFVTILADGKGTDLLVNAETLAARHRCHLALLDMRLINDDDAGDRSGLELVSSIQPTYCIIVSGSPRLTRSIEREARDIPGIVDCVTKGEPSGIWKSLKKTIERYWNLVIQYKWPDGYSQTEILNRIRTSNPSNLARWNELVDEFSNELDVALRGLYRIGDQRLDIASLHLKPLERTNVLSNYPLYGRRSVVLYAVPRDTKGDDCIREVVKFAPREHIVDELQNYQSFVNGKLASAYRASIDGSVSSLRDIGALRYTEVDGERFIEWYNQVSDIGLISKAINHLFDSVLRPWWDLNPRHKFEHNNVYGYYLRAFPNLDRWIDAYRSRHGDQDRKITISDGLQVYDPVLFAFNRRGRPEFRSWWNTVIHGDLHAGNIFVKNDQTTCVIDFERSRPGYFLQDFVELEKSIRLQLLHLPEDKLGYALYLDCLLDSQERLDQPPAWELPEGFPPDDHQTQELRKAFTAICSIRTAAAEIGDRRNREHMEEYYWALLMETLFSVTRPDGEYNGFPNLAHNRALLAAAVLCERLERWNNSRKKWPPEEWEPFISNRILIRLNSKQFQIPSPGPMLRLSLTSLRNVEYEFRLAVTLETPNRQPHTNSTLPFRSDSLIAVMKLLETGGFRLNWFDPAQKAALKQMNLLLEDNSVVHDWCDRIGHDLFDAIVPTHGGVRTEFENAFYKDRKGGELQLIFDSDATDLACQPWELLHDGFPNEPRTPIDVVRYIASGKTAQPLGVPKGPCHILYMTARPNEYAQAAHDRDTIMASVVSSASPGRFEFEELPKHTHQELKQRLMDTSSPIHVLHFDGHGTFARLCPECGTPNFSHELSCGKADNNGKKCGASLANAPARGYLLFETDTREAEFIETTRFLEGIQRSEVRLVVLSSCQSARVRGADLLLAGVGPGLILAGVPAVVAMQFSISDQNAIQFNREFYRALAQGDSLPNAVYRARTMLDEPTRWSPVLYLRSRDHQIHLCPPK